MFRQVSTVALVVLTALGSLDPATAQETKEAGGNTKSPLKELTVDLGGGVKLEMLLVPAGEFLMGSPASDKDAFPDEKPQHRVRITKPFYLGKYPVTQEQWQAVMGDNPSSYRGPKNPVDGVSWDRCQEFLSQLNVKFGPGRGEFRLPTEAQWEYACRAGSITRYYFGDDASQLGDYTWYEKNSGETTHPVGQKKPNAWGLYDMLGNVWEWCQDWDDDNYYAKSPVDDPTGPSEEGIIRVYRGGGWFRPAKCCRSASRINHSPGYSSSILGFRVSRVAGAAIAGEPPITNSIGMKLTPIPTPGSFTMGSSESAEDTAALFNGIYGGNDLKADAFKDEHPQHRVQITRMTPPFCLGTYHVTRGQFRRFVEDSGYKTDAEKADKPGADGWNPDTKNFEFNEKYSWRNAGFEQTDEHPVVCVSWNDAVAFCKWLSDKEGGVYRLPTEAEWEFACRAGTTTRYYSGDDPESLAQVGNVADAALKARFPGFAFSIKSNDGYAFTAPVGSFQPNAFGLYDMHGNARQWCADFYDEKYYGASPANDPTGPDANYMHVLRGSSWYDGPHNARSASRIKNYPFSRDNLTGFRVVKNK